MLKINQIIIAITFIISNLSIAQTLHEGPANPVTKGEGYQKLIGSDESSFYVYKRSTVGKGVSIIIEKFNSADIVQVFSQKTKVSEIQEKMDFPAVAEPQLFLGNDRVFVFFESYDKKSKKIVLFLQTVSKSGEMSDVFEICSSNFKYEHPIEIAGRTFFDLAFSPDKKAFAAVPLLREGEDSDKKTCYIYDALNFQKKAERIIPKVDNGLKVISNDYTLDNRGNLFFSMTRMGVKKSTISEFSIGLYEPNSPTLKSFPVTMPNNKVFNDYSFKVLQNGDLLIVGVLSDTIEKKSKSAKMNPSFFVKRVADNTLEVKYEHLIDFAPDVLNVLGYDEWGNFYDNTEVFEMNSDVYIVTQRTKKIIEYKPFGKMILPYSTVDRKELVVTKLDNLGKLLWSKVIPKYHAGTSLVDNSAFPPRYAGNYKSFIANGNLNFVFYDHINNESLDCNNFSSADISPVHATMWGGEGVVAKDKPNAVCVSVNEKGILTKSTFLKFEETGLRYVAIENTVLLSNKKLLIFLENRKMNVEKFGVLNFE